MCVCGGGAVQKTLIPKLKCTLGITEYGSTPYVGWQGKKIIVWFKRLWGNPSLHHRFLQFC